MITVRNQDQALSLTARAGAAGLKPGMLVKLAQGAASGDQPTVVAVSAADIADVTVKKFIVDYIPSDSQHVDFDIAPATQVLTALDTSIPNGAQVNIWSGTVVIAYHDSLLPTGFKAADVRESAKLAFDADTDLPAAYNAAGTDGTEVCVGYVYRVDAPEVTFVVTL